jgi:hypothetical protein
VVALRQHEDELREDHKRKVRHLLNFFAFILLKYVRTVTMEIKLQNYL